MQRLRFVPGARRRKIRVVADVSFQGLDPLTYEARAGVVRRREPKRDKSVSARQAQKAQKAARRQLKELEARS